MTPEELNELNNFLRQDARVVTAEDLRLILDALHAAYKELAVAKKAAAEWERVAMDKLEDGGAALVREQFRRCMVAWCLRRRDQQPLPAREVMATYDDMAMDLTCKIVDKRAALGDLDAYYYKADEMRDEYEKEVAMHASRVERK